MKIKVLRWNSKKTGERQVHGDELDRMFRCYACNEFIKYSKNTMLGTYSNNKSLWCHNNKKCEMFFLFKILD